MSSGRRGHFRLLVVLIVEHVVALISLSKGFTFRDGGSRSNFFTEVHMRQYHFQRELVDANASPFRMSNIQPESALSTFPMRQLRKQGLGSPTLLSPYAELTSHRAGNQHINFCTKSPVRVNKVTY